jgi:hypothetical protein
MMTAVRTIAAASAAVLLASGCSSSSSSKADAGAPNTNCGGATKACLTGVVTTADTADNVPPALSPTIVPGATISLADGTVLGTANDQGWYFVRNVPAGASVPVCFEGTGYTRRCRNLTVAGGQNLQVSNTGLLQRPSFSGAVAPAAGGTITLDASTQITFPANAACLDTGGVPSGTVSCALTPIVGANEVQRSAAPGDFRGTQTGGTTSQLVTGGMMEIVCKDGAGAKVNVCSGKTATIRFPVDAATCTNTALHPATMKSWGYDEAAGVWKEYGTFTKTCGASNYYEGAVNHFSYWNADDPVQTTCAKGRVLDGSGAPVLGALVRCDGDPGQLDGYQGPSEAYSGADGGFCAPVRRNSSFKCIARKGAFVSAPLSGHSGDNTLACGATGCTALGDFTLTDPLARIVLTWGELPSDLDSHLVGADYAASGGVHVYFSSRGYLTSAPFIELDTDDITGFGPEIVSFVHGAKAQKYRYCVHNFSGYYAGPPVESLPTSGAIVDAFLGGDHVRVPVPTAANSNDVWRVLEFTLDGSGTATGVRVINDFKDVSATSIEDACMQ